eukprot:800_1
MKMMKMKNNNNENEKDQDETSCITHCTTPMLFTLCVIIAIFLIMANLQELNDECSLVIKYITIYDAVTISSLLLFYVALLIKKLFSALKTVLRALLFSLFVSQFVVYAYMVYFHKGDSCTDYDYWPLFFWLPLIGTLFSLINWEIFMLIAGR